MGSRQNVDIIRGYVNDFSVRYRNSMLINTEVFPIKELATPKMKILTYNRGEQFQSGAERREPGAEIRTTKPKRSSINTDTKQYAASDFITREDLRDAGLPVHISPPVELVKESLESNAKDLDLGREIRVASHIFADTWADGVSGGTDVAGAWANASTSTFLADFDAAILALKKEGVPPDKLRLMLDFGTMQKIKRIDDVREQLKYTSDRSLTADALARILQISKIGRAHV